MRTLSVAGLAALILVAGMAGIALSDGDQDRARALRESGEIVPLEQIVDKAREEFPGRILEVELEEEEGILIYEVEILSDSGVVREFMFDARTGELIGTEEEDD